MMTAQHSSGTTWHQLWGDDKRVQHTCKGNHTMSRGEANNRVGAAWVAGDNDAKQQWSNTRVGGHSNGTS